MIDLLSLRIEGWFLASAIRPGPERYAAVVPATYGDFSQVAITGTAHASDPPENVPDGTSVWRLFRGFSQEFSIKILWNIGENHGKAYFTIRCWDICQSQNLSIILAYTSNKDSPVEFSGDFSNFLHPMMIFPSEKIIASGNFSHSYWKWPSRNSWFTQL